VDGARNATVACSVTCRRHARAWRGHKRDRLPDAGRARPSAGNFTDTIVFSNAVSGVAQTRVAEVRVASFTSMPFAEDFESGIIQRYWFVSGSPGQVTQISSLNGPRGNHHLTWIRLAGSRRATN